MGCMIPRAARRTPPCIAPPTLLGSVAVRTPSSTFAKVLILGLAPLLLASCSREAGVPEWTARFGGPERTGARPSGPSGEPEVVWRYTPEVGGRISPVGDGERVYIPDGMRLVSLDLESGRMVWRADLPTTSMATPALAGEAIFMPTAQGTLVALRRKDGEELWIARPESSLRGDPIAADGKVWGEAHREGPPSLESVLYAFAAEDGRVLWTARYKEGAGVGPTRAGRLVLASRRDALQAYDAETGKPAWSDGHLWASAVTPAVVGPKGIYYSTFSGSGSVVRGLRLDTGEELWVRVFDTRAPASTPALAGGILVIAVTDDGLHGLDLESGEDVWRVPETGLIEPQPVVGGEAVYWTADTRLHASALKDGHALWERNLQGKGAHLILVGDTLIVSQWHGDVIALRSKPRPRR